MAEKPYRYNTKLTIYQCDVEDFVRYDELYLSGKVYDACLTQECWYLKPLVMDGKCVFFKEFACDCQFVPLEHKKEELITRILSLLEEYAIDIPYDITSLERHTMYDLMYQILPSYFPSCDLDLDDVFGSIGLPSLRTMYHLKFSDKVSL